MAGTDTVSRPTTEQLEAVLGPRPEFGEKSFDVKVKTDGLADGEFIAYASVFGNKDMVGDVVMKGAFSDTLAQWKTSGAPIPLLWGHNMADPDYNLGWVDAEEDEKGLRIHGYFDMDSPKAPQTYRLLKSGRTRQFSITYRVTDGAYVMPEGEDTSYKDAYYEIRALDLFECSVVQVAANQEAEVVAVKSAVQAMQSKAGRTLSAKNEDAIRGALTQAKDIVSALESVLPAEEADEKDQEQTSGKEPPPDATEQKSPSQSDTATPSPSVLLALAEIDITESEIAI